MTHTAIIHASATTGFADATSYDTHRPSYPPEAVEKLLAHVGLAGDGHAGARIIDLAAGTGKLTELLAARPEGYEVLAVEPHEGMRGTLEAKKLRGVASRSGTATDIFGVEDGWADVVVAAQAFHWFANQDALKEIRRVLKPGGKLAMIWNIEDYNKPRAWKAATAWEQQLHELIIDAATDGQPRFRDDVWWQVFDEQDKEEPVFTTPVGEDRDVEWNIWLSKGALWDRVHTLSHVSMLRGEARDKFRAEFDRILEDGDGRWNDEKEVLVHGISPIAWTTRL